MSKRKIINDPVHGFITIAGNLVHQVIDHPYFQRLRRIKQLGLTEFVYPGAHHTRFHHALGAMHLMGLALNGLREKGHLISDQEFEAAQLAILLHDIGHGPFSHALEHTLLTGVPHERLSLLMLEHLNAEFDSKLEMAKQIFTNSYHRRFFNQLVSSQLDIDRLDYLLRDCYFTGVVEGLISADRIIKMMDVRNDELVVEEKGIYSIENFLSSRRLMYWQVYLHRTTVCAEQMLIQTIRRAKFLFQNNRLSWVPDKLAYFLQHNISEADFYTNADLLPLYAQIDDADIWYSLKHWQHETDKVLALLSGSLLNRDLFKSILSNTPFESQQIDRICDLIMNDMQIEQQDVPYLLSHGAITNEAYVSGGNTINILRKDGSIVDVAYATDLPNIQAISKILTKYFLCFPKNIFLHNN